MKKKLLLFIIFFKIGGDRILAQCTISVFNVTLEHATCASNGSISVKISGVENCFQLTAVLSQDDKDLESKVVPKEGGTIVFPNLGEGQYDVKLTDGNHLLKEHTVMINSSYAPITLEHSALEPSCKDAKDGVLTIRIMDGTGIGPFVYESKASGITQTSGQTNSRTWTFTGFSVNEKVDYVVIDKGNNEAGCEVSKPDALIVPGADYEYEKTSNLFVLPFQYECIPCDKAQGNIRMQLGHYANESTRFLEKKFAYLKVPGHLTLEINDNGILHDLVDIAWIENRKGELTAKFPILLGEKDRYRIVAKSPCGEADNVVEGVVEKPTFDNVFFQIKGETVFKETDGCSILTQHRLKQFSSTSNINKKATDVCRDVPLKLERKNEKTGVFEELLSMPPEFLGFAYGHLGPRFYEVETSGIYRVTYENECYSMQQEVSVSPVLPLHMTVTQIPSIVERTVAFEVNIHHNKEHLVLPYRLNVEPKGNETTYVYSAEQPYDLAEQYSPHTFDFEKDYDISGKLFGVSFSSSNYIFRFGDLPADFDEYKISVTDACGKVISKTVTVDKSRKTVYDVKEIQGYKKGVKVVVGCQNSNQILVDLGTQNVSCGNVKSLYKINSDQTKTLIREINVTTPETYRISSFPNLTSGNYILEYNDFKYSDLDGYSFFSEKEVSSNTFKIPIKIPDYQEMSIKNQCLFCSSSDPNSGIIETSITGGVPIFPLTYTLYAAEDIQKLNPLQTYTENDDTKLSHIFSDLSEGEYFVEVSHSCFSIQENASLDTSISTFPKIQASRIYVCPSDNKVQLFIAASEQLYNIEWKNEKGDIVGKGASILVTPEETTKYEVSLSFNSINLTCNNLFVYTTEKIVYVIEDPRVDLDVSHIETCEDSDSHVVVIKEAESNTEYEILDENAMPLEPRIKKRAKEDGDLYLSFPKNQLPANLPKSYPIKVTRMIPGTEDVGCSLFLEDSLLIIEGTPDSDLRVKDVKKECLEMTPIVIEKAEKGVTYELVDAITENPLSEKISEQGIGGEDLILNIPESLLKWGNNTFKIKAISLKGCSVILNKLVTVLISDTQAPQAPILSPLTGECSVSVSVPEASDVCEGTILGQTNSPLFYDDVGVYTVTWNFSDSQGNTTTSVQQVQVLDTQAPQAPVLSPLTGECSVSVSVPEASDVCEGTILGQTNSPLFYDDVGVYTITWNFSDSQGNTTTSVQQVQVLDTQAPQAPILSPLTGECSVSVSVPEASDVCEGTILGQTNSPLFYDDVGVYTITWNFSDSQGNTTTSVQQVQVLDTQAPQAPILSPLTGECSVSVSVPEASDVCEGTILGQTNSPLFYDDVGVYTVTWNFSDSQGNTTTSVQQVQVLDTQAPQAPVLSPLTGECSVSVSVPEASDVCEGTILGQTNSPLFYDDVGVYTITWNFSDSQGNTTTSVQQVFIKNCPDDEDNDGDGLTPGEGDSDDEDPCIPLKTERPILGNVVQPSCQNPRGSAFIMNYNPEYAYYIVPNGAVLMEGRRISNAEPGRTYMVTAVHHNCVSEEAFFTVRDLSENCNDDCTGLWEGMTIFQFLSPNNDGVNDEWNLNDLKVYSLKCAKNSVGIKNTVRIFNRYGAVVFEKDNYMLDRQRFRGKSLASSNYGDSFLPPGVYFYVIEVEGQERKMGHLYITGDLK